MLSSSRSGVLKRQEGENSSARLVADEQLRGAASVRLKFLVARRGLTCTMLRRRDGLLGLRAV